MRAAETCAGIGKDSRILTRLLVFDNGFPSSTQVRPESEKGISSPLLTV